MVWSEQDAKANWCPIMNENCMASKCMMWRKKDQIGIGPNGEKRDRDMDGRTRWVDRGYCGLAGSAMS